MINCYFPQHLLYRSLGSCVCIEPPPEDQRLTLLNDVWKAVTKLREPPHYIGCAEIWIEYVVQYFGVSSRVLEGPSLILSLNREAIVDSRLTNLTIIYLLDSHLCGHEFKSSS